MHFGRKVGAAIQGKQIQKNRFVVIHIGHKLVSDYSTYTAQHHGNNSKIRQPCITWAVYWTGPILDYNIYISPQHSKPIIVSHITKQKKLL